MAWIYFQEVEDSQRRLSPGAVLSPIVKSSQELNACCCQEWPEENSAEHRFGMTCALCGGTCCPTWTSSPADSHAKTLVVQEMERAWLASEAGLYSKSSASLASADPDSYSWKTFQLSLFGGSTEFSWESMRWGMMRDGLLFQPQRWAPRILENESGFLPTPDRVSANGAGTKEGLLRAIERCAARGVNKQVSLAYVAKFGFPTPRASDGEKGGPNQMLGDRPALAAIAARWPTATARDWKSGSKGKQGNSRPLSEEVGGQLNPTWVEWLMGWPIGSTVCESWVMEWFRPKRGKRS